MRRNVTEKVVALTISVAGGLITYGLVHAFVPTVLAFLCILFVASLILARGLPVRIVLPWFGVKDFGFVELFPNQLSAQAKLISAAGSSNRLDIMLIRGYHFIGDKDSIFDKLLEAQRPSVNARVLLLEPGCEAMENYLTNMALAENQRREYSSKCKLVQQKLDRFKAQGWLQCYYYATDPIWKLVITDSAIFWAAYDPRSKSRGAELPLAQYRDYNCPVYVAFSRYFESVWNICKGEAD